MVIFRFHPKENLVSIKCSNEVTFSQLSGLYVSIFSDNSLPRNLKIFEDSTSMQISLTISELNELVQTISCYLPRFEFIRHAVLHTDNKNIARWLLLAEEFKGRNYALSVFTTELAANRWLNDDVLIS